MDTAATPPAQPRRPSVARITQRLRKLDAALRAAEKQFQSLKEAIDELAPLAAILPLLDPTAGPPVNYPLLRKQGRVVRERAKLTRKALAQEVGVAETTIRNFETGRNRPTRAHEARLLRVLADLAVRDRHPVEVCEHLRAASELFERTP